MLTRILAMRWKLCGRIFEMIYRGPAEEILNKLNEDKNNLKGEFVVVIRAA
jgi:16S rRNA C1402 (ribose-2'-O) methylase RsmI